MSIGIAIVEDNEKSAATIVEYLKKYEDENNESFNVTVFSDGDEIASDYKPDYQIIFMDIQLKRMDGMSTAEFIRSMDKDVILIFITNMAQYAIRGYAVDAMDFLLKPVPYFAFSQQLKRSLERLKKRETSYILLPIENGVVKMDVSQIVFIESYRHKVTIHTKEEKFNLVGTMKEFEKQLQSKSFFRCNNCYLVNLACVKSISGSTLTTIDKRELIVSRPRKKAFMDALAGFVGRV